MNRKVRFQDNPWYRAGGLSVMALLTLLVVLGLAVLLLDPPTRDIQLLTLFLCVSGVLSLVAGYVVTRLGWRLRRGGLRLKIALSMAVGIVVALANVAVTAYLMFFNSHDLALLSLLLLFALLLSLSFGFYVSGTLTSSIRVLSAGAARLAEGDLTVRVDVPEGDELGDLARAFNSMAEQLETAFRRQIELEQARKDLIASVSHDLRTPLTSAQAMVEALYDGIVGDPATVERYLRTMRGDIRHLSDLISDLFELSQLDAGVLRLQMEARPIQDLILNTVETLEVHAQQKGLSLHGDVQIDLGPVMLDSSRVQRVLYNLVQNAIRHTPADGTVQIEAHDTGTEVEVSVVDTGEGLRPEDVPHVFERFYRGDPARSRQQGGAGLGLTIARGLIEAHGGRIWVESTPGSGCKFSFTLPKAASFAPSSRGTATAAPRHSPSTPPRTRAGSRVRWS